ncbi:pyridoxal phosphate-dependent transferase [Mycena maculata]|uniref:Pyridoxal phosphate-dependent transferase n=1 Tax=Mycena maculata TaxID=230809 RepID=A0AAD7JFR2_9AGAR|nr:pyridoxal phosphate-dependent transferase [Mycena maculata]
MVASRNLNVSWRNTAPPDFGHAMLEYFAFDPEYTNLNHGSYGSLPLPVIEACRVLDSEAESNPDRWIKFSYLPRLTTVRQRVAAGIGAKAEECVLVPNTSHGISTVLRNIEWQKDDIIVVFNTTYNSVASTAQFLSDIPPRPLVSKLTLVFPTTPSKVITQFREHLKHLPRKNGQKVVAIIDSIISMPAILLPWKEIVQVCKEEDVMSLIDAAHSIGQEPNLDLNKADPDFWISNLHKWSYAKRSCAVLYVPLRNQHLIKTTFPTSASYLSPSEHSTSNNFVEQFDWWATIDFVPYLSVATALDFRQWLGGEEKINTYCRRVAIQGSKRLAEILGTTATIMDPTGEMTLNMVNVQLPLSRGLQPRTAVFDKMKDKMILERKIFAPIFFLEETGWWTRCSAQIWTEVADFEKLGHNLLSICSEVVHELGAEEAKVKSKL